MRRATPDANAIVALLERDAKHDDDGEARHERLLGLGVVAFGSLGSLHAADACTDAVVGLRQVGPDLAECHLRVRRLVRQLVGGDLLRCGVEEAGKPRADLASGVRHGVGRWRRGLLGGEQRWERQRGDAEEPSESHG